MSQTASVRSKHSTTDHAVGVDPNAPGARGQRTVAGAVLTWGFLATVLVALAAPTTVAAAVAAGTLALGVTLRG